MINERAIAKNILVGDSMSIIVDLETALYLFLHSVLICKIERGQEFPRYLSVFHSPSVHSPFNHSCMSFVIYN